MIFYQNLKLCNHAPFFVVTSLMSFFYPPPSHLNPPPSKMVDLVKGFRLVPVSLNFEAWASTYGSKQFPILLLVFEVTMGAPDTATNENRPYLVRVLGRLRGRRAGAAFDESDCGASLKQKRTKNRCSILIFTITHRNPCTSCNLFVRSVNLRTN